MTAEAEALVPMAELSDRWAVTPNTVSRRLAFLGIKPIRQGNYRFLTPEQVKQAQELHEHILSGKPQDTFPGAESGQVTRQVKPGSQVVRQVSGDEQTAALTAAMASALAQVRSEPQDPLALAKRLADAAQLGVPLTNAEMAAVLGRASVSPKHNGTSPRPGFTLERIEHNGAPFWMVHRAGAPTAISASPQASQPQGRQVGFTAASMAVIDVQARDCTGSDLFATTMIG